MTTPNPFEPLGLPPTWQPSSLSWRLGNVELTKPGGTTRLHVLVIDTATGRDGFAFTDAELGVLVDALSANRSGLEVARVLPEPNGRAR